MENLGRQLDENSEKTSCFTEGFYDKSRRKTSCKIILLKEYFKMILLYSKIKEVVTMVDVAIISKNPHIQRSLSLFIHAHSTFNLIYNNDDQHEAFKMLDRLKKVVVLLDIDVDNLKQILDLYSTKHHIILYSHSKDFLEISQLLQRYNVKYFNVYTKPDCIFHTIKELSE